LAVVTFVKYKPGKNSTPSALKAVINYCNQPYKTQVDEQIYSISGKDCNGTFAYREFMATKKLYGKSDGVMFYHYVQSFSPEENITPEEANKIGIELAKEFSGFEVLVATHIDRAHIHNHLILNSVSFENGYKLRQNPNSLQKLRNRSDEICLQYGKSVLPEYQKPAVKGLGTREYRAAEKGQSWKFQLMNAVDKSMNKSGSRTDFEKQMQKFGYEMVWTDTRKYISFICPNGMKCRDIKLHDQKYLKENLENELQFREQHYKGNVYSRKTAGEKQRRNEQVDWLRYAGNGTDTGKGLGHDDLAAFPNGRNSAVNIGKVGSDGYLEISQGADGMAVRQNEGTVQQNGGVSGEKSDNATDGSGKFSLQDERGNRTGWEETRAEYERYLGQGQTIGSRNLQGIGSFGLEATHDYDRNINSISDSISSVLCSASKIIEDDNEDPEERKKRIQAQENGDILGVIIGFAIGLAVGSNEDSAEETENQSPKMEL